MTDRTASKRYRPPRFGAFGTLGLNPVVRNNSMSSQDFHFRIGRDHSV